MGNRSAMSVRGAAPIKAVAAGPRPIKGLTPPSAVGITTTGRPQGSITLLIRRPSTRPIENA